jgi:hypothetical protein
LLADLAQLPAEWGDEVDSIVLELGDRLVHLSCLQQNIAQVVYGLRVVGLKLRRPPEVSQRHVHLPE